VRDVARVQVGTEDHVRIIAGDGKPAALINVTRQVGGNTLALADSVARIVAAIAPTLPPGVHLKPVYDQAALVRDAVRSVRDAMLVGAALAVLVLLLFLRHGRITAVSAAAIPLTLAVTVFVMNLIGQTFNLMTLVALGLALTIIPLLAEQFVTAHEVEPARAGLLARLQQALDALGPRYERALGAVLDHPRHIVIAAAVLVAVGLGLFRLLGTGFLPEMDEGAFVLDYFTPGSTALAETNRQVGIAEQVLAATP